MTTRELFEAEFPVPPHVFWDDKFKIWDCHDDDWSDAAEGYENKWIGFQAGYKAGKDGVK